jgi:hypothetical protein
MDKNPQAKRYELALKNKLIAKIAAKIWQRRPREYRNKPRNMI